MPVLVLTVSKFVFLALLYFFVYRAVRSMVVDLRRGPRPQFAEAPAGPPRPAPPPRQKRRGKAPRQLVVMDERGRKAETLRLDGTVQIGRADACHLRLQDSYASQFHAKLFPRNGAWFVEDLGSTNGTFLNQRKVTTPVELRIGDKLRIGKTTMELKG